jgi:NitT/TauT family transport system permease protein
MRKILMAILTGHNLGNALLRICLSLVMYSVIWFALSICVDLRSMLLPDAYSTLIALHNLVLSPQFWMHIGITVARVVPGVLFSVALGVPIGLLTSRFSIIRIAIEPLSDLFRGIPVASIFPVAIILFGVGEIARFWLTVYVCLPIMLASTIAGASNRQETEVRRGYLELHRSKIAINHRINCLLWDAAPSILAGLKIALSLSLVVIIVSEMFFVGGKGVGWYIWDQYQSFKFPQMYASILSIGLISMLTNFLVENFAKVFKR